MSRKPQAKILVVDLESTCDRPTNPEPSEIIEVGWTLLDIHTLERENAGHIFVRPIHHPELSTFCKELTSITQEQADGGINPADMFVTLEQRLGTRLRDLPWASYGDYDRVMFQRHCELWNLQYPMHRTHTNVKNLFAFCKDITHPVGMDTALKILDLPLYGHHHRGQDDSWNIALILSTLLKHSRDGLLR